MPQVGLSLPAVRSHPAAVAQPVSQSQPVPPGKAEVRVALGVRTADGAVVAGATFLVPEDIGILLIAGVLVTLLVVAALTA
jgi:hypothetical protein